MSTKVNAQKMFLQTRIFCVHFEMFRKFYKTIQFTFDLLFEEVTGVVCEFGFEAMAFCTREKFQV